MARFERSPLGAWLLGAILLLGGASPTGESHASGPQARFERSLMQAVQDRGEVSVVVTLHP
ncbi:MAG: hypothetical protein L0170_05500, partial [Acidobacteria bacterium]|nr:hypothetical protein [Acidobacteriota bacterium]